MFDVRGSDIETLQGFLRDSNQYVDGLLANAQTTGIIESPSRDLLLYAWRDKPNQERFVALQGAVPGMKPESAADHGLVGAELDAKVRVIQRLAERSLAAFGGGIAKRVLDAIDALLDSIIDVAGVGGGIKELKDLVKASIDE